jgi:hypothetical protein
MTPSTLSSRPLAGRAVASRSRPHEIAVACGVCAVAAPVLRWRDLLEQAFHRPCKHAGLQNNTLAPRAAAPAHDGTGPLTLSDRIPAGRMIK